MKVEAALQDLVNRVIIHEKLCECEGHTEGRRCTPEEFAALRLLFSSEEAMTMVWTLVAAINVEVDGALEAFLDLQRKFIVNVPF